MSSIAYEGLEGLSGDLGFKRLLPEYRHGWLADSFRWLGDTALGGVDELRQHPVGSLEVGGALAASGLAAAAAVFSLRNRHQH